MSRFVFVFIEFWRVFVLSGEKRKWLEECKLMSHSLVYLKSVNYIRCKIFTSLLSCVVMFKFGRFDRTQTCHLIYLWLYY